MKFHTKLKTASVGNNTFYSYHTQPKKLLCNKYSDIRFRPDFKNFYPVHP